MPSVGWGVLRSPQAIANSCLLPSRPPRSQLQGHRSQPGAAGPLLSRRHVSLGRGGSRKPEAAAHPRSRPVFPHLVFPCQTLRPTDSCPWEGGQRVPRSRGLPEPVLLWVTLRQGGGPPSTEEPWPHRVLRPEQAQAHLVPQAGRARRIPQGRATCNPAQAPVCTCTQTRM